MVRRIYLLNVKSIVSGKYFRKVVSKYQKDETEKYNKRPFKNSQNKNHKNIYNIKKGAQRPLFNYVI